jgi:iron(III) transport system ATP-binding protein
MSVAIELDGVSVTRDGHRLLEKIDLRVDEGATLAVSGPSGSGKSTLLRTIVGLEAPTAGRVTMFDTTVSASGRIHVPPEQRRVAIVFQDLGLWPHMSVAQHLQFALIAQRLPRGDRTKRVVQMLRAVGLHGRETQRPSTLSGGERQRLAIARALVTNPPVLLLDEPLSNLDLVLKDELIGLLAALLKERRGTTIFVTHDLQEVLPLTMEFAILEHGRLVQRGAIAQLNETPATPFVRALVARAGYRSDTSRSPETGAAARDVQVDRGHSG